MFRTTLEMRCRCGSNDIEYLYTFNHVDIYYCIICQGEFGLTGDHITPESRLGDQYGE